MTRHFARCRRSRSPWTLVAQWLDQLHSSRSDPDRLGVELLRLGVGDELLDGLGNRGDLRLLDSADLARRLPVADQVRRRRPRPEVERPSEVLTP